MSGLVYAIDDDPNVRDLLVVLLSSVAIATRTFASASQFLQEISPTNAGCLFLDVRMPETSGLDVLDCLRRRGFGLPVIMMSCYADVPMVTRAFKAGVVDFVEKPFNPQDIIEKVQQIFALDQFRSGGASADVEQRLASLSARERQVLELILKGLRNKEIAAELGVGQRTIETHRANLMKKMACKSLLELIQRISPPNKADLQPRPTLQSRTNRAAVKR